ncbi:hypothetical protein [Streptomyces capparidis]
MPAQVRGSRLLDVLLPAADVLDQPPSSPAPASSIAAACRQRTAETCVRALGLRCTAHWGAVAVSPGRRRPG